MNYAQHGIELTCIEEHTPPSLSLVHQWRPVIDFSELMRAWLQEINACLMMKITSSFFHVQTVEVAVRVPPCALQFAEGLRVAWIGCR